MKLHIMVKEEVQRGMVEWGSAIGLVLKMSLQRWACMQRVRMQHQTNTDPLQCRKKNAEKAQKPSRLVGCNCVVERSWVNGD